MHIIIVIIIIINIIIMKFISDKMSISRNCLMFFADSGIAGTTTVSFCCMQVKLYFGTLPGDG